MTALPEFDRVGAVIVVAPYGRPVDLAPWRAFAERTGRPVVIDAAACFDTLAPEEVMASGLPVAISLHATKTLSTAEGGLMLCSDPQVIRRAQAAVNFGFDGARRSVVPGFNGKLSEYHAAIGLADLETWPAKRASFTLTGAMYAMLAERAGIADRLVLRADRAVPYALFVGRDPAETGQVAAMLGLKRIEARRWYGDGLQSHPAFQDARRMPLPVSTDLAARVLGLPFAVDLPAMSVSRVIDAVALALWTMPQQPGQRHGLRAT